MNGVENKSEETNPLLRIVAENTTNDERGGNNLSFFGGDNFFLALSLRYPTMSRKGEDDQIRDTWNANYVYNIDHNRFVEDILEGETPIPQIKGICSDGENATERLETPSVVSPTPSNEMEREREFPPLGFNSRAESSNDRWGGGKPKWFNSGYKKKPRWATKMSAKRDRWKPA